MEEATEALRNLPRDATARRRDAAIDAVQEHILLTAEKKYDRNKHGRVLFPHDRKVRLHLLRMQV